MLWGPVHMYTPVYLKRSLLSAFFAFHTHINGISGHQKLSFWKTPSTLKMFNNSFLISFFILHFGRAKTHFWKRWCRHTGFISVVGKCELRVCFMILDELSLYGDRMDVMLYTFIFRKTLIMQRWKRDKFCDDCVKSSRVSVPHLLYFLLLSNQQEKTISFLFTVYISRYLFPQTLFTEIPVLALEITEWNYCFYCRCSSINTNFDPTQRSFKVKNMDASHPNQHGAVSRCTLRSVSLLQYPTQCDLCSQSPPSVPLWVIWCWITQEQETPSNRWKILLKAFLRKAIHKNGTDRLTDNLKTQLPPASGDIKPTQSRVKTCQAAGLRGEFGVRHTFRLPQDFPSSQYLFFVSINTAGNWPEVSLTFNWPCDG